MRWFQTEETGRRLVDKRRRSSEQRQGTVEATDERRDGDRRRQGYRKKRRVDAITNECVEDLEDDIHIAHEFLARPDARDAMRKRKMPAEVIERCWLIYRRGDI